MATNPPLQGALLLVTQLELVSGTTAAGTFYGIAFTLYCLYLHASLPQHRNYERKRQGQLMIACSTILMICGLYFLVFNAWLIQDAYIKHGNFPGGPLVYENSTFHGQPVMAVEFVCETVVDVLTAAIQIWRLYVVWSSTRYSRLVVVLPFLSLLGSTGKSFKALSEVAHSHIHPLALAIRTIVLDITLPNPDVVGPEVKVKTANIALQASITILPTILIAGLLIFESRRQSKLIGTSQLSTPYMNVITVLVESYAMEATWTILYVVLLSLNQPATQFFADTLLYIKIIAYLLVLYRVANGRACGSQKAQASRSGHDNLSSLHWNQTTAQSDVTPNGIDSTTRRSGLQLESGITQV